MMTSVHTASVTVRGLRSASPLAGLKHFVARALTARAERHHLAELDDAALADIGLTRAEAEAEARRPIWDVPTNWRR